MGEGSGVGVEANNALGLIENAAKARSDGFKFIANGSAEEVPGDLLAFIEGDEGWSRVFAGGSNDEIAEAVEAENEAATGFDEILTLFAQVTTCLLYTSPSPRD